jgi:PAS domain S-box-containing protein
MTARIGESGKLAVLWVTCAMTEEAGRAPALPADAEVVQAGEDELGPTPSFSGSTIFAAVIASSVEHPARVARWIFRNSPEASVFFFCPRGSVKGLTETLAVPLLGRRFEIVEEEDEGELPRRLQEVLDRFRRRRRLRTTLDRANLQLKTEHLADSQQVRRMAISERFLAGILSQTPDAIFSVDLDNVITSWNGAAQELFGLRDVEGLSLERAGLGDLAASFRRGISECRDQRRIVRQEVQSAAADWGERHLDLSFAPLLGAGERLMGVSVVARDITARRQALAKLWKRERELADLVRLSPVGIARFDSDGRCIFVNEHWSGLTGRAAATALGDGWQEAVHPEDRHRVGVAWQDFVRQGGGFLAEYRLLQPSGVEVWVESRAARERDQSGALTGFVGVFTDTTIRKQAEQAMLELNTLLEERVEERTKALREMNEQLETFVYSAAHDLRAPARAISGFVQLVLSDHEESLPEEARAYLQRAVVASERMDELIRDLLHYSRLSQQKITSRTVSLERLMERVQTTVKPELDAAGATLEVHQPLPPVLGHPSIIEQALLNLVTNALKFVPPDVTPTVSIRAEDHNGRVRVWVEDNGIGIDPRYQERIFGVFERLHGEAEYAGTGIGLAIVRKGIERMGGSVGVVSRLGEGSRFWLELPAASES